MSYVVLAGLTALTMKTYLMYMAIRSRGIAAETAPGAPERLVAADVLINNALGIVMALAVAGLGGVFLYAVFTSDPPDGRYELTQGTILLLILLITLGSIEMIRGVWGILSLKLITDAVALLRQAPEQCAETTFAGCPYISPERVLTLQAQALRLAADIGDLPTSEALP